MAPGLGMAAAEYAAALTTFAFYFAVLLLFAARGVPEFLASRFGRRLSAGCGHPSWIPDLRFGDKYF